MTNRLRLSDEEDRRVARYLETEVGMAWVDVLALEKDDAYARRAIDQKRKARRRGQPGVKDRP
jgi:hypothetical protein